MNPFLIIIVDGIWIVREFCHQILIECLTLCDALDEIWYFLVVFVLPRILSQPFPFASLTSVDAPVAVEILLNLLHLFYGSFFSIFLHTGIDGGVDFQTA